MTGRNIRVRRSKRQRIYSRTSHRLRELERVIAFRHGVIPDTDDAGIYLDQVVCCHLNLLWKKTRTKPDRAALLERLDLWCERFGPDTSAKLRRDVVRAVLCRPRLDDADTCARRLRLSYAERTRLRITTIGSYDLDKRERARRYKARKRERDRRRAAAKRAAVGAIPRAQYLAESRTATRPWEAEDISRRNWYRKLALGTGPSPTSSDSMLGDGLVPRPRRGGTAQRSATILCSVDDREDVGTAARQARGPVRAATHADDAIRPAIARNA
jgi:hypothetical protein